MQNLNHLKVEINENLEFGEMSSVAKQLGLTQREVASEVTRITKEPDEKILSAFVKRLEARGVCFQYKTGELAAI